MSTEGSTADPFDTDTAQDLFAIVGALKSLARGGAAPILPVMSKSVVRAKPSAPAAPAPVPIPVKPETAWTKDDLRAWRHRLGIRSQVEAAALMGMKPDGYSKLEKGQRDVRAIHVRLARYIEAYGPLP